MKSLGKAVHSDSGGFSKLPKELEDKIQNKAIGE